MATQLGDVRIVKDCMICQREVILLAKKNMKEDLPENNTTLPKVCEECRDKYLRKGVLIINPDNGNFVVVKNGAFKRIFKNTPIPILKIAFAEQNVIEIIMKNVKKVKK